MSCKIIVTSNECIAWNGYIDGSQAVPMPTSLVIPKEWLNEIKYDSYHPGIVISHNVWIILWQQ